ncbi:MAG: replication initiation protein [Sulfurospirillum sp.]|nr:replication initiation protein [Sulfurospirillum sp.]
MQTNLTNRNYFRESPSIVNGRYSLTKNENNLIMMLLTAIDKDDEDFKDYVFTKKEFEAKTGVVYKPGDLKSYAKSLMSKVLEVKKSDEEWELFNWFSYFKYDRGTITCGFDKRLKPYLLSLKQYIFTNQSYILTMKGQYSKRIYMMLREYMNYGERKFNVKELQDILQVPKSYKNYSKFKQGILLQTVKDINKFTDIEIKNLGTARKPVYFEEIKPSRKVEGIIFYYKKNWNDIKMFIEYIREKYVNEALYENKENRMLKCSARGLLYYADNPHDYIDKIQARKIWEWLHEHREKLYIHQDNLFTTEEEIEKKLINLKEKNNNSRQ